MASCIYLKETEAVVQKCYVKMQSLKTSQNSCDGDSFLIKLQVWPATLLKRKFQDRRLHVNFVNFLRSPFFKTLSHPVKPCYMSFYRRPRLNSSSASSVHELLSNVQISYFLQHSMQSNSYIMQKQTKQFINLKNNNNK